MQHSKRFKRKDGTRVEIWVRLIIDYSGAFWSQDVYYCPKGKRKFLSNFSTNDYTWRALDQKERNEYKLNKQLEYCTLEEIQEVKKELRDLIPLD